MFSMRVFFATVLGSSRGMPVMSLTFQRSPRGDIANGCIVSPNTSYNLFFFFMVRWGQDRLMGREIPESVSTYAYDGHHPPLYIQHIKHTPGSQTCPPNVLLWHGRPLSPAPTLQNTNILSIIVFPSFFFFFFLWVFPSLVVLFLSLFLSCSLTPITQRLEVPSTHLGSIHESVPLDRTYRYSEASRSFCHASRHRRSHVRAPCDPSKMPGLPLFWIFTLNAPV